MRLQEAASSRSRLAGRFSRQEVAAVIDIGIPGLVVSLEETDGGEVLSFRVRWAPQAIAATLCKKLNGLFALTCYHLGPDGNYPEVEATFPSFVMMAGALVKVFD